MLPPDGLAALGHFLDSPAPIEFNIRAIGEGQTGVEDHLPIGVIVGLRGPVGC